jgi:large subunit ribosomal protein L23
MQLFSILKKPIVTHKSQHFELKWVYTIVVDPSSTKVDIKKAFSKLYNVWVESVNIVKMREKFKKGKKWVIMKRRPFVKALIKLKKWEKVSDLLKVKDNK